MFSLKVKKNPKFVKILDIYEMFPVKLVTLA